MSTADLDMQDRFGRRRILDRRARCQEAIGDEVVALRRAVELARKATRCCRDGRHPH